MTILYKNKSGAVVGGDRELDDQAKKYADEIGGTIIDADTDELLYDSKEK